MRYDSRCGIISRCGRSQRNLRWEKSEYWLPRAGAGEGCDDDGGDDNDLDRVWVGQVFQKCVKIQIIKMGAFYCVYIFTLKNP